MCGIYGITKNDTQFIHQFIEKCTHRGPDGSDIWHDEDVTLGHNLLAITSEPSQGKQPWKTPKGNVLVYNGEIFNYQELCNKYHNQFTPTTTCDTELLAFLLDKDPIQAIKEIDSMHGFAYYDRQTKKLIISRDHAGIKPLYYAETQDGLVFGSEIKGMLDKVPNSNKIDDIASACMSYCGVNATNHSLFNNIRKVMPGQTLTYDVANKKFTGSDTYTIHPTSNKNLDLEEFKHEAHETVKMSTLGIRKFGMFLSGGLDSTLVAHELNSVLGGLDTFTNRMNPNIITDEDHNDDANHARMFADDYKMNHTEIEITPQMMMDCWDKTMWFMEQPVYNWNMPMYYETNKKLAKALGDELLGGYPKYWKLTKPEEKIKSWEGLVWKWMHRIKRPVEMKRKISKEELHAILIKQMPQEVWNPADHVNSYMALDWRDDFLWQLKDL